MECPMCLLYLPRWALNEARCCRELMCSECYFHVQDPSHTAPCPYCQKPAFGVVYDGDPSPLLSLIASGLMVCKPGDALKFIAVKDNSSKASSALRSPSASSVSSSGHDHDDYAGPLPTVPIVLTPAPDPSLISKPRAMSEQYTKSGIPLASAADREAIRKEIEDQEVIAMVLQQTSYSAQQQQRLGTHHNSWHAGAGASGDSIRPRLGGRPPHGHRHGGHHSLPQRAASASSIVGNHAPASASDSSAATASSGDMPSIRPNSVSSLLERLSYLMQADLAASELEDQLAAAESSMVRGPSALRRSSDMRTAMGLSSASSSSGRTSSLAAPTSPASTGRNNNGSNNGGSAVSASSAGSALGAAQ